MTVKKSGEVTITATRAADANYSAVSVDWTFTVEQKPAEPTLNLASGPFVYTSNPITPLVTVVVEGKTLGAGEYAVAYSNNVNAGAASVSVSTTRNMPRNREARPV